MAEIQLSLFPPPRQPRRQRRENGTLMAAVWRLRKKGHHVYAEGRLHRLDGKLLSTRQLMTFARSLLAG